MLVIMANLCKAGLTCNLYVGLYAQKGPLPCMEPIWQRKVGLLSRASSGHKRPEP